MTPEALVIRGSGFSYTATADMLQMAPQAVFCLMPPAPTKPRQFLRRLGANAFRGFSNPRDWASLHNDCPNGHTEYQRIGRALMKKKRRGQGFSNPQEQV